MGRLTKAKQISRTTIAYGGENNIKNAALYYDYVLPICFSEYPEEIIPPFMNERDGAMVPALLHKLYLDGIMAQLRVLGYQDLVIEKEDIISITWHGDPIFTRYKPRQGKVKKLEQALLDMMDKNPQVPSVGWDLGYESAILRHDDTTGFLDDVLKFNFTDNKASYFGMDCINETNTTTEAAVMVTLSNVKLANVKNIPWDQILEFRKDRRSINQFRKLKQFILENNLTKSKRRIEDEFEKRAKNYQSACTKHGIKLQESTLKLFVNAKHIVRSGVTDLIAKVIGKPNLEKFMDSSAITLGVALKLKSAMIETEKVKISHKYMTDNTELACHIEAFAHKSKSD